MFNKVRIVARISNHQWGAVLHRGGVSSTIEARDYKYPVLVLEYESISTDKPNAG